MNSLARCEPTSVCPDVAEVVWDLAAVPVSDEARYSARLRLADTAFATLVGSLSQQGRRSAELAADLYGRESAAERAFRLVAACRMTEIDDVDLLSCVTPGSIVVPTVLAVVGAGGSRAVRVGLDGVLDAVARGYEVSLGLGEAIRGPHRLASGVWPSLAVGGVTAAAVASWLLGATEDEASAAVVLASQQSIQANPRGNARETLLAGAVVTGIGCALAVRQGFSVVDRQGGGVLADLLGIRPSATAQARIRRPSIKPFCSARQTMTAVSAVREMVAAEDLLAGEVDRIDVEVPIEYAAMLDKPSVGSRRESLSSAQYQVALAMLDPDGLYDVDRQTLRTHDAFRSLMSVVHVHAVGDLSAQYPARWPARVRISAGGRTFEAAADEVPGECDVSAEHLTAKLLAFSRAVPGPSAIDLVERAVAIADLTDLQQLAAFVDGAAGRDTSPHTSPHAVPFARRADPEITKEPLA